MTNNYASDEAQLTRLSHQSPSTPWGQKLFREVWPQRFPGVLSSETYRGYASVLSRLLGSAQNGMTLAAIEGLIDREDRIVKSLPSETAYTGGANLAVVNAWQDAHAIDPNFFRAKLESELIFTARMFVKARQLEQAGAVLA